jgi:phenylacetate-CoA ligase
MSLYTRGVADIVFPLHERLKGHDSTSLRRQMEDSQWWPAGKLEELRFVRLQALLRRLQQDNPYYRRVFAAAGFSAERMQAVDDLAALPFLDKATIRANCDVLKSVGAKALQRFNTGGSSGEPLIFYLGRRVSHDVAAKWRATRWWGVDIGDREIVVWGSPIELGSQDRLRALRDRILRTRLLPAFEMSDAKIASFIRQIADFRPRMLFGYPSALARVARYAATHSIRLDDLGVKVAFVTAERLYPEQREQIAATFGCGLANGYGARDAGFIAHECPHGGMHITAEDVIVEIVDREGKRLPVGQRGEIVVTHLGTWDFPFIRYRTGDIGTLDANPCSCGRGLPLLKEIDGRATDFIVAADGTVMHGLALIYVLRDLPAINAFKIIQETTRLTRVQVVPGQTFGSQDESRIRDGLRRRLGDDVQIDIEIRTEIAPEKSGKHRYVVSHVAA